MPFSLFGMHFITSFSPWPSYSLAWHWGTWGCKVVRLMRKIKAVCIFLHVCQGKGFSAAKALHLGLCVGRTGWLKSSLSQWHLLSSLLFCHWLDSCPPHSLALRLSLSESLGTSPLSVSLSMREGESDEVGKWGRKGRKWVDEEEEAEGRTGWKKSRRLK